MSAHITLTPEQLARLEAAIVSRPARTFVDRSGITRTTQVYINHFVSSLIKFHKFHGYLTEKQLASVAHIVQADKTS